MTEASKLRLLTGTQAVQEQAQGALILDTRPAERFASFHIRRAVQISLAGRFASWAAFLIMPRKKIVLVGETVPDVQEAYIRLTRVGLGLVIGSVVADETSWRKEGLELASISVQQSANVREALQEDPSVQLVDGRSRAEWLKGHLPGAISPCSNLIPECRPSICPNRVLFIATKDTGRRPPQASCFAKVQATSGF